MNRCPRIEPGAMRLGCTSLLVVYSIIVAVRLEESHGTFLLLRLAVCAYAAFGIWLSGHVTWRSIRAYTVGLAFLLPLQAGYVDATLGNHVGDVTITALATFVPLVFRQTARDTVVVALGLGIGHGMILASAPTPAVPLPFVGMMLGGVIATGTTAGLHALLYRGRWTESFERLEEALRINEGWKDRYEAASLASGQLLYDWDPRTDTVSYGGAYERILDYSLDEMSGGLARWLELIHPEDRPAFEAEIRRVLGMKTSFHGQYRVRRKDGRYIVVEDNGYFVLASDGNVVRMVGFIADVTKRQHAEAARAEEATTTAALARVGQELISSLETPVLLERLCRLTAEVLDCDFSHTWIWDAAAEVYVPLAGHGLAHDEAAALRLVRIPSGPATPMIARFARDEIVQVTAQSAEHPVVAALLAYYGFGVTLCLPLRRRGEMIGIQSAGYRTRTAPFTPAQERVARGIAQLASMAITNARLVEELERASRLKSEFVSTMSHELRTPLNVILGYTDMLADTATSEEQQILLARVRQSSLELLEMIEATLNLSRIAAGKDTPSLEALSLVQLWDELSTEFAALPRQGNVELRWLPPPAERLRTDRRKLKMILKNLVGNALKFTPAGAITVSCTFVAGVCELSIRDTGIGIPAEHLPHVFEMFRQVDSSDARSYGGAGLGLYIVRQLADQLGGRVDVESEAGQGSRFRVTLPVASPHQDGEMAA